MRVTNGNMMNSYLKDVQSNLQNMDKINNQLNTGKQINKISDDPLKTIKILNMKNEIDDVEKYNYNCDEVTGWLDMTDEALDRIGTLNSEMKTLLTSISGAFGKDEIKAISTEVNEKIKQIAEAMNTTYGGKYIFGGTETDTAPVSIKTNDDGTVSIFRNNDNNGSLGAMISSGINQEYNLSMDKISKSNLEGTDSKDAFELLDKLSQALKGETVDMEQIGKLSKDLDEYSSDILNNRSIIGAKTNTVEKIKDTNNSNILEMQGSLSNIQDVDFAEKYIKLKEAEMAYTASLQVSSKVLQSTILDYLR